MAQGGARDPLVGQVLGGRFRIEQLLDRGGMGKVYRAVQEPLGREVAVKTLDIVDPQGRYQQRFFLEASALAKLSHPNTVRVIDYGNTDDGVYYFAMEFLRGANLHRVLQDGPLEAGRAVHILEQVAGALAEAHSAEIVHRDLKPANVFLTRHGDTVDHVKVIDFGLVKDITKDAGLSVSGEVLGTPAYMAPEQVDDGVIGPHTDVYAVGILLYECLTGQVPFTGKTSIATLMMHLNQPPPPVRELAPDLEAPESLVWLCHACLQKAPSDRPRDMREVLRGLRVCARQIRGELDPGLRLSIKRRVLVLPPGVVEEVAAPLPARSGARAAPSAGPSVAKTAAVGAGVAGGLILLLGLVVTVGVVGVVVGAGALWASSAATEVATTPVVVESEPAGAMVRVDGHVIGHTPYVVEVPEGEWVTVEIKQRGFKLESRTLYGNEGRIKLVLTAKNPNPDKDF